MDVFTGRLYAFLPCYLSSKADLAIFENKIVTVSTQDEVDELYVNEMKLRVAEEIAARSRKNIERGYLGSFLFNFYGKNEKDNNCTQKEGRVYYTLSKHNQLCVLNIVFTIEEEPVTQFLDRVSREDLQITNGNIPNSDFYAYLKEEWGLGVVGKARVCLSSGQTIHECLKPSLFASEMYESSVMESALLHSRFGDSNWKNDIAIYDSSHIYASKTTVLRCDLKLDKQNPTLEERQEQHHKALRRDLMLNFIIEILMFREASIKRANLRVNKSIQEDELLSLDDINDLMGDFKSAILFWDLDIFLYPTGQQLADTLNTQFDIDRSLDAYHKNQNFLEQRVNLFSAIEAEKETRTINYIAVIVFFFESLRLLFFVSKSLLSKEPITAELLYSSGIAFSGSMFLFLLILLLVKIKRLRVKRRRSYGRKK